MPEHVDLRCPSDLRRLFMRLRLQGERPVVTEDNWIQVACPDCVRAVRQEAERRGFPRPDRVLHYFSFMGELMRTEVVAPEGENPLPMY